MADDPQNLSLAWEQPQWKYIGESQPIWCANEIVPKVLFFEISLVNTATCYCFFKFLLELEPIQLAFGRFVAKWNLNGSNAIRSRAKVVESTNLCGTYE